MKKLTEFINGVPEQCKDKIAQLERQLAAVTAERDALRADLCTFAVDMEKQLSAVTAERDELEADRETELQRS